MKPRPNEPLVAYAIRVAQLAADLRDEARMLAATADTYQRRAQAKREHAESIEQYAVGVARQASVSPNATPVVAVDDPRPVDLDGLSPTAAQILDVVGADRISVAEIRKRVRSEYGRALSEADVSVALTALERRGLVVWSDGWRQV